MTNNSITLYKEFEDDTNFVITLEDLFNEAESLTEDWAKFMVKDVKRIGWSIDWQSTVIEVNKGDIVFLTDLTSNDDGSPYVYDIHIFGESIFHLNEYKNKYYWLFSNNYKSIHDYLVTCLVGNHDFFDL